eukprot:2173320-Pyramimonas_sp.AAC.1
MKFLQKDIVWDLLVSPKTKLQARETVTIMASTPSQRPPVISPRSPSLFSDLCVYCNNIYAYVSHVSHVCGNDVVIHAHFAEQRGRPGRDDRRPLGIQ